jgi:hypothetical protein
MVLNVASTHIGHFTIIKTEGRNSRKRKARNKEQKKEGTDRKEKNYVC